MTELTSLWYLCALLSAGALGFLIAWYAAYEVYSKMACHHYDKSSKFRELHRGYSGLYLRSTATCKDCGRSWCETTLLPKILADVIDESLHAGTLERKS